MAKISTWIISMIVFSMVLIGGFGALMASISTGLAPGGYNSSKIDLYNKLDDLTSQAVEIENKTQEIQGSKAGINDILGGFFEAGYNAMILSYNSIDIFQEMASSAKEDIPNLDRTNVFFNGIITIIIVIVIFIILRIVVKGDL